MINDFISMVAAAVLAILFVFIANHLSKKFRGQAIAKWVMPAAAGLAMLGYTIYAEYAWFPNMERGLPQSTTVAQRIDGKMIYRPWTFFAPLTTRFVALDAITRDGDFARAGLLLIARWGKPVQVPVVFDCANAQRADLIEGVGFENGALVGNLQGGGWRPLDRADPVLQAACVGG